VRGTVESRARHSSKTVELSENIGNLAAHRLMDGAMTQYVIFQNPRDGNVRAIKLGLDWRYPIGAFALLWPLSLVISCLHCAAGDAPDSFQDALLLMEQTDIVYGSIIALGGLLAGLWLGAWSPARRARQYMRQGWVFADPWDPATMLAARKWKLSLHYLVDC